MKITNDFGWETFTAQESTESAVDLEFRHRGSFSCEGVNFGCADVGVEELTIEQASSSPEVFTADATKFGSSLSQGSDSSPHLVEEVAEPLGDHEHDHDGQPERDVSGRLDEDHSEADGHAHDAAELRRRAH